MIKDIKLLKDNFENIYKIRFACDDNIIILSAYGACCSNSWFEYLNNASFKDCIGKTYVCCSDTYELIDMNNSGIQEVDINHIYEILFEDKTTFRFLLRNSSNGYYDGFVDEKISNIETKPIEGQINSLILLVGLPGCGKTTYANILKNSMKNTVLYDDIDMMLHSNITKVRNDIINNKKVIISNTKLCLPNSYHEVIDKINLSNKNESIITYCFLPNKAKSIQNIKTREKESWKINKYLSNIELFSNYYTNSAVLNGYNCKILETY